MAFRPEDWQRLKRIAEGNPGKYRDYSHVDQFLTDKTALQTSKRLVHLVLVSTHCSRSARIPCKCIDDYGRARD